MDLNKPRQQGLKACLHWTLTNKSVALAGRRNKKAGVDGTPAKSEVRSRFQA